jgi:4a-hydroxytetrahydrobiopterin dehydratase
MNKLASLKQISSYRPKALSPEAHTKLTKNLSQFKLSPDFTYLKATFTFPNSDYNKIVDRMTVIGQIADNMDHHPEWTLKESSLEIGLSTHECQGKVSIKDYILATWIEQIWN